MKTSSRLLVLIAAPLAAGCGSLLDYADTYTVAPSSAGAGGAGGGTAGAPGGGGAGRGGASGRAGTSGASAGGGGTSAGAGGAGAGGGRPGGGAAGQGAGIGGAGGAGGAMVSGGGSGSGGGAGRAGASGSESAAGSGGAAGSGPGVGGAGQSGAGASGMAGSSGGGAGGRGGQAGAGGGGATGGGAAAGNDGGGGEGGGGASGGAANGGAGSGGGGQAGAPAGQGGVSGGGGSGGTIHPSDCSVLYVSPTGRDDATGCLSTDPLRTPVAAMVKRSQITKEMRLCAGSYTMGGVALNEAISMRGSYSCADFSRGVLDALTATTVISADREGPALRIEGPNIGRDVLIQGLVIEGRQNATTGSIGMLVAGGASPSVEYTSIVGGSGTGGRVGSIGLFVTAEGAPRIFRSRVRSGTGKGMGDMMAASAAGYVDISAGLPSISYSVFLAGDAAGEAAVGSVGLLIEGGRSFTGANALTNDTFVGGNAQAGSDAAYALTYSAGIYVLPGLATSQIELRASVLLAGTATATSTIVGPSGQITTAGLWAERPDSVVIDRCRLYGGDAALLNGSSRAVGIRQGGTVLITSSLLHGGGALAATPFTTGVDLRFPGELKIVGSTVLSGLPRAANGLPTAGTAISLDDAPPRPQTIWSNFFVMMPGNTEGIRRPGLTCAPPPESSLRFNTFAFTQINQPIESNPGGAGGGCASSPDSDIRKVQNRYPAGAAEGNVRVARQDVSGSDILISCGTADLCLDEIFYSYDAGSNGYEQTRSPVSTDLRPHCQLGSKGVYSSLAKLDLVGVARPTTNVTAGAIEPPAGTCK